MMNNLNFSFLNNDDDPVLFIQNMQTFNLKITNYFSRTITIAKLTSDQASKDNHHFELQFKKGVLASQTLNAIELVNHPDWSIQLESTAKDIVSLYLLNKIESSIPSKESIVLQLANIKGDGQYGTRGARVEFKYRNIYFQGDDSPMEGNNLGKLNIVNYADNGTNKPSGPSKHHAPLHVAFVGNDMILNDGQFPNQLTLRVSNISNKTIQGNDNARFNLNFQAGATPEEGLLGTTDQIQAIQIQYKYSEDTEWKDATYDNLVWTIPFSELSARQYLDVQLSNIVTGYPSGQTFLLLSYENLKDYWDGQNNISVLKLPITFDQQNIGIGVANPKHFTQVNGELAVGDPDELHDGYKFILHGAYSSSPSTIQTKGQKYQDETTGLYIDACNDGDNRFGAIFLNCQARSFASDQSRGGVIIGQENHKRIRFPKDPGGGLGDEAWIGYYAQSGESTRLELGISNDADDHIILMPSGNVGISNSDPSYKLDVNGAIRAKKYFSSSGKGYYLDPEGWSSLRNAEFNGAGDSYTILATLNSKTPCIYSNNMHPDGFDFYAAGNNHYGHASSIRLKEAVEELPNALEKLLQIRGVSFKWKSTGKQDLGFIAEEVGEIIPEAVQYESDGYAKSMSYSHVLPLLVESVKEQQKTIEELKAQIEQLQQHIKPNTES